MRANERAGEEKVGEGEEDIRENQKGFCKFNSLLCTTGGTRRSTKSE
jgi:hypothetical protein